MKIVMFFCLGWLGLISGLRAQGQNTPTTPAPTPTPANVAHFHHLTINTTDPVRAVEFYATRFDCERGQFQGQPAIWAQKSWLLFNKVTKAPSAEMNTAIWHMGWGAEDMKAEYERQLRLGTRFFTPLTDISDIGGNPNARPGSFLYAYVESPDRNLIEINTAAHHRFGHLHLFSADPVSAGEWYEKHLGARLQGRKPLSRAPRMYREYQIGPSASLLLDNLNIIIFPVEYVKKDYAKDWQGRTEFASTKGRIYDNVGISFDNVNEALTRLRAAGVKVLEPLKSRAGGKYKSAFIEGPDKLRIELVEGHARKE